MWSATPIGQAYSGSIFRREGVGLGTIEVITVSWF